MSEIPLTQGQVAIVHDDVVEWVSQWKWYAKLDRSTQGFYAARNDGVRSERTTLKMHNAIWEHTNGSIPEGLTVDHADRNGLNNDHTTNLRLATRAQQNQNRRTQKTNRTGFRGVSWRQEVKKYRAKITVNGNQITLGYFTDPLEARAAYRIAELHYSGEFARTQEEFDVELMQRSSPLVPPPPL